tara:strand:+ start:1435 stop:1806 length:372 start_codon:yes stop_codon:yes gene_type:complete
MVKLEKEVLNLVFIAGVVYSYDNKWYIYKPPSTRASETEGELITYVNGVEEKIPLGGQCKFLKGIREVRIHSVKQLKERWGVSKFIIDNLAEKIFPRGGIDKTRIQPSDIIKIYKVFIGNRLR